MLCGDIEDICPQVKTCEACYNNPDNSHEFGHRDDDEDMLRVTFDTLVAERSLTDSPMTCSFESWKESYTRMPDVDDLPF